MRERFGRAGHWVWMRIDAILTWIWLFIGRVGLAIRKLWTRFVWKPFWFLTKPFRFFGRWLWQFGGRVGLAERNLLLWLVWEPFLFVTTPFRKIGYGLWLFIGRVGLAFRKLLVRFVWRPFGLLIGRRVQAFLHSRWQAGSPKRAIYRRRLGSRYAVFRARLRVMLKRPKPPETVLTAPRQPQSAFASNRLMRTATIFISVSIVLVVSLVNLQDRQPGEVAAESFLTRIVVVTPTPGPETPAPDVEPTVEVVLTPWPTPDLLGDGGTLAFEYHREGNSDIYLLPVGQAKQVRLTSHPAADREPSWRPDGQEIAFSSHRDGNWEIYVYNFTRGELRRITNDLAYDGNPGWSADGVWLVYESYQENNLDIYIVKADLSEGPYRLTTNRALDFAPVWSPGGRHVAFTSWRSGNRDIFILSLDEISDDAAVNVTNSPSTHDDDPAFSPDGRNLSYSVHKAGLDLLFSQPLAEDYSLAGSPVSLGQQGRHSTWSPDSQSLVYAYNQGQQHILIAGSPNAWGVAPQAFVGDGWLDSPTWSPVNLSPELVNNLGSIDGDLPEEPLFVEAIAAPQEGRPPVQLWELPISAPAPYLSDQVDQSFLALQKRVIEETGWDFLGRLDGMYESVESKPLPGQESRSWNKTGRAFDFYYREALAFEPRVEVVRQETGSGTYWRVYIRTAEQDGSMGEPLREVPWDFQARYGNEPRFYDEGGKLKEFIPSGYYVDFTALAADYGWEWVPSNENWRTYFPAIRFWHYENRKGLTWEQAMLQIYTTEELSRLP